MPTPTPTEIVERASPRPWTYHNDGGRDWIEDARGETILNNLGYLDGRLIVACVNEAHDCGTEDEAITNHRSRQGATAE